MCNRSIEIRDSWRKKSKGGKKRKNSTSRSVWVYFAISHSDCWSLYEITIYMSFQLISKKKAALFKPSIRGFIATTPNLFVHHLFKESNLDPIIITQTTPFFNVFEALEQNSNDPFANFFLIARCLNHHTLTCMHVYFSPVFCSQETFCLMHKTINCAFFPVKKLFCLMLIVEVAYTLRCKNWVGLHKKASTFNSTLFVWSQRLHLLFINKFPHFTLHS